MQSDQGRAPRRRAPRKRGRRPSPEQLLRDRFPHAYQLALEAGDDQARRDLDAGRSELARRLAERGGGTVSRYLQRLEMTELRLRNEATRDQSADVTDALTGLSLLMGRNTLMEALEDPDPQQRAKAIFVLDSIALTPRAHLKPHRFEIIESLLRDLNLDNLDVELVRTQLFTTNPSVERKDLAERYNVSRQAVDQRLLKLIRRLSAMYEVTSVHSLVKSVVSRAVTSNQSWYFDVRDPLIQFIEYDSHGQFPQPIDVVGFAVWLSQLAIEDPYIQQSMRQPTLANPTHWVRNVHNAVSISGSPFELVIHPGDDWVDTSA